MASARVPQKCGNVDARMLVPVKDEIGGIVVYAAGRPAYYVLQDEWFEALPEPRSTVRVVGAPEKAAVPDVDPAAADVDPAAVLRIS